MMMSTSPVDGNTTENNELVNYYQFFHGSKSTAIDRWDIHPVNVGWLLFDREYELTDFIACQVVR